MSENFTKLAERFCAWYDSSYVVFEPTGFERALAEFRRIRAERNWA